MSGNSRYPGPVNAAADWSNGQDPAFMAMDSTKEKRATEDCSGLQKDLDEMKDKCMEFYKEAKDNIISLKIQLDELYDEVSSSNSPGSSKDVLKILQKFVELQEIETIMKTEKDNTNIEGLEKREMEAEKDLAEMTRAFFSVELLNHTVSKRSAETSKSEAISIALNEFKKYLEDRLKKPGERGGIAEHVLQIVKLQIEAMDLQTRLASKYKTQAQIDVITNQLEYKKGLVSDLKEEREEMTGNKLNIDTLIKSLDKEILDLKAELSALKQTLIQLDGLAKEFDNKRTEVMDKIGTLKGKDELVSRILTLQFEYMEALINAQGQIKADEFKINDLQKELEKEQERTLYFQSDNENLRGKLIAQTEQCNDVMDMYQKAEAELDTAVKEMADSTSKKAVQIILLGYEIDQVTKDIKKSPSNDDLKRRRDEKLKEMNALKKELEKSEPNSGKILKVISQMEEIWKLQSEDPDNLQKISNLQKNVLNLIEELDDKMPSKPMLQILALQADVSWIREMLQTVKTQAQIQKAELQKELDKKEQLLNEKNKELATAIGDVNELKRDIAQLKKEVSMLKTQISTAEETAKKKIKDLEEQLKQSNQELHDANTSLKEKNALLARQVTKINNLIDEVRTLKKQAQDNETQLNARITDLERKLIKKEEENEEILKENEKLKKNCVGTSECPELQKKYEEMQAEYNTTISKLNSDILQKAFYIKALIDEVENLDRQIAQGFPGLIEELEEKEKELEEAKRKLRAQGSISAKTLDVLQLLSEIWKLEENPTEENSKKIQRLEAKLNVLLSELQNSENGLGLALNIMSLKESMSRLKQGQTQMQEKYTREINGLKKQIDDKEKEILMLKANCGQDLKDKIQQLEEEVKESKQKLKKLQQESDDQIASLEKQISRKNQQLATTEDKLEQTNAENAALIKKLNSLNDEIDKITDEKNNALKKAEKEIAALNDKLQLKDDALAKKDVLLKEKDEYINVVKDQRDSLKEELGRVKERSKELETDLKIKDQQLATTKEKLKKADAENERLVQKQKQHDDELKKITEEKNNLQNKLQDEINDLKKTVETQNEDLAKKSQKLQEKEKEVTKLQKENDDINTELKEEKKKYKDVVNEKEKIKEELDETKKKLEEAEEKKELPQKEWPSFDANTAHRRLILSQDKKEARTSLLPQSVSDTPARYDTAIAALATFGFNTGKHYWEIGVAGRSCYVVGVARESVQRKGILRYSPSAGYWVILKKRDGTLVAIDDREVRLNIAKTPSVVGVQVNFKNNEVALYNAENKSIIYKFTGNDLKEKVYPYIETCSDSSINEPPLILREPQLPEWLLLLE